MTSFFTSQTGILISLMLRNLRSQPKRQKEIEAMALG